VKNKKLIIVLSVSLVSIITIITGLTWFAVYTLSPPDKDKAERYFKRDYKSLETIIYYMENSDRKSIRVHKTMSTYGIKDEEVVEAINRLFEKRGYDVISKNGNTIHFLRWTRFRDFGSGIAYSINGIDEPDLQYLTKLEPLSESNWYYYEEDFNEWRIRYG